MLFSFAAWALSHFVALPPPLDAITLIPGWTGVILGATCLIQFGISLAIDSRYEPAFGRYYYWMIWYPMIYWTLHTAATVVAVPKAMLKKRGTRAVWVSPDRGVRASEGSA
jgi:biofilm PGA synthesis N-glycosyltransferase PgaC